MVQLALVAVLVAGSAVLGVAMAPAAVTGGGLHGGFREVVTPGPVITPGPVAPPPVTSVTPATTISPPTPPPPGALAVNSAAWRGHGNLAFVSSGQLEVLSNAGALTDISGPTSGGYDSNPAWSPDGRWLAFLHTGAAGGNGYDVPAPTLWMAQAGSSAARQVTTDRIGTFAWSPVASQLAYTVASTTNVTVPVPQNLFIVQPGSAPVPVAVAVGDSTAVSDIAWSPNGTQLAFDDLTTAQPASANGPATQPMSRLGVVSALGGTVDVAYELTETGIRLAGWWPQGGGLLFWEDPGFAESADGQLLYSLASESHQPMALVRSLIGPTWITPEPGGSTVAVVAGGGRSIWQSGRDVDLCRWASRAARWGWPRAGPLRARWTSQWRPPPGPSGRPGRRTGLRGGWPGGTPPTPCGV
jgi:dipeptidyl aminopeptidase/acylaminoacyl peptidase